MPPPPGTGDLHNNIYTINASPTFDWIRDNWNITTTTTSNDRNATTAFPYTTTADWAATTINVPSVDYTEIGLGISPELEKYIIELIDKRIKELFGYKAYQLGLQNNELNRGDYDGD